MQVNISLKTYLLWETSDDREVTDTEADDLSYATCFGE
jgi:hypothetical protein